MKKIIKSILGISIIIFMWFSFSLWDGKFTPKENPDAAFPFGEVYKKKPTTDISSQVDIKNNNSIITKLLDLFNLDIVKNDDHKFLNYVKAILNVALWLLSVIALVMTIYTFYMMFFTDNEAWAKKAKWNLVGIFIALAIIWLSWLIVSFIFRWYQENWQRKNEYIEKGNITMLNYEMDQSLDNLIYLTM